MERRGRAGKRERRAGTASRRSFAALVLVVAAVAAGAIRLVDRSFEYAYRSVDFGRPADFFAEPDQLGPSDVALASWAGTGPLEVLLGPVERGDVLKLNLRTEAGKCTLAVRAGPQPIASLRVTEAWVQHEVVSAGVGASLILEPVEPVPCLLHVSRISVSNVTGHAAGAFPIFVRHALAGAPVLPGLASAWLLGVPMLTAALLAVWRRRTGEAHWSGALAGAAVGLAPAALVVGIAEALRLAGGRFVAMPPRTFLVLLFVPPAAAKLWRCRAAVATVVRATAKALVALLVAAARALASLVSRGRLAAITAPLRRAGGAAGRALGRLAAAARLDTVTARSAVSGAVAGRRLVVATMVFCAVLAVLTVIFARVVVQDFAVPLFGTGDLSLWEQQNHYVAKNLALLPLPHLDLHNDELFYPYGGNNVFQPWVFELHLAASTASRAFGPWGWCQLYFVLSVVITALGTFLLLVRDHGAWRAGAAAVAVSFCGYYAIGKYAGQYSISVVHWTVLSVIADFALVSRVVDRKPWSARLLLVRAFLLFACLGLELGYVAGLGLTSAFLTGIVVAVLLVDQGGWSGRGLRDLARDIGRQLRDSASAHPFQVGGLALAAAAAAWVYVPLVLQVSAAAREFDFSGIPTGYWWANPLRMLLPILPGFNPITHPKLFDDTPEGAFAASPGLALVLAALLGVAVGRKRLPAALPALTMLVLLLSYHPQQLGHLRVLPWFSFVRVTGRFTVVYPALLAVLALMAPPDLRRWRGRLAVAGLVGVLGVEATTAYRAHLVKDWEFPRLTGDSARLMNVVRSAPGEAVLDWPFCIAGGNGVATGSLCRFYDRQCGIASLQAFHEKKVVGAYFGRLHPSQIQPYIAAGWPRLFVPDDRSPFKARRQRRDFEPDEWEFIERFVRLGDFAGVLLYLDRLPAETVAGFHARFGPPAAAASTLFGKIEFIPKPETWRADVDVAAARRLVLPLVLPVLAPQRLVAMGVPATDEYLGPGWGSVWKGSRTSEARSVELRFRTEVSGPQRLRLMGGAFRAQRVAVSVNGVEVGEIRHDGGAHRVLEVAIPEGVLQRDNVVRFDLPEARTPRSLGLNDDDRLLGITVEWFRLDPAQR